MHSKSTSYTSSNQQPMEVKSSAYWSKQKQGGKKSRKKINKKEYPLLSDMLHHKTRASTTKRVCGRRSYEKKRHGGTICEGDAIQK